MAYLSTGILAETVHHLNVILIIGIAVFGGNLGAHLFQKLRIPQVVGYIVIGLIIGQSGLGIIGTRAIQNLHFFSLFALGIIAFMIGGELRLETFKKYGKQLLLILCSEGIAAFVLVSTAASLVSWAFTRNLHSSLALGLVLGAIASATAPAATVNVLWEYKTRGPLTSTVLAIVALDDALALLLYGFASSIASVLTGSDLQIHHAVLIPVYEILGSIALGLATGLALTYAVRLIRETDKALTFTIASVLLVIGVSVALKLDSILAAMALGATIANLQRSRKQSTFKLVEKFAPPIYVLFFVLAGAHLQIKDIAAWMLVVAVVYIVFRSAGKFVGSWFGAGYTNAPPTVQKYLGLCLLSQAGVAIGLAIISSEIFPGRFGDAVIMIVMTTTFVVEVLGPLLVRFGVRKAGEVGLNVTEDDLIRIYTVAEVMDDNPPTVAAGASLTEIIEIFGRTASYFYPVVDNEEKLLGAVTIDGIRSILNTGKATEWLIALDIMEPAKTVSAAHLPLSEALETAGRYQLQYIPVVDDEKNNRLVGVLDTSVVQRTISAEILARQQKADAPLAY